jgi:hypothetical protein
MPAINRKPLMRRASNRSKGRHGKLAHRGGFPLKQVPNFFPSPVVKNAASLLHRTRAVRAYLATLRGVIL